MKLGVYLFTQSNFNPDKRFPILADRVKMFDEFGLDSLWISDGLTAGPNPDEYPHYETISLISALSQHSTKIDFGTLVSPFTLRPVSLFSKMITTLDHITKGRIIAGIGVGNASQLEDMQGIRGLPLPERIEEFENYLISLKSIFEGKSTSNENLNLSDYSANPPTYNQKGIRILVAGNGERKTLHQVAKYADMSNIGGDNKIITKKLEVLASWCDKEGRKFEDIENTTIRAIVTGSTEDQIDDDIKWYKNRFHQLGRPIPSKEQFVKDRFVGTVDQVVDQIAELTDIGINHVILTINTENTRNVLDKVYDGVRSL